MNASPSSQPAPSSAPLLASTAGIGLPDPLIGSDGKPVETISARRDIRRSELLELFREQVYGRVPSVDWSVEFTPTETSENALAGRAIRRQVRMTIRIGDRSHLIDLLLYVPKSATTSPVPTFALLNFDGNDRVGDDPAVPAPRDADPAERSSSDDPEETSKRRHPIAEIIDRGYGYLTAYRGDVDPDFDDGFANGIHGLFEDPSQRSGDSWGTVAAWAWALSRMMDYCEQSEFIDANRVIALGHSRLGKAALWAGATDERFAMVISNNSGCTGAALARGKRGETIAAITEQFPHWFAENYARYAHREAELPLDQHELLSLIAPRPLAISSASEDAWADPEAEYRSLVLAGVVYALHHRAPLPSSPFPEPNGRVVSADLAYYLRVGKHALTCADWQQFLDFADGHLSRSPKSDGSATTTVRGALPPLPPSDR